VRRNVCDVTVRAKHHPARLDISRRTGIFEHGLFARFCPCIGQALAAEAMAECVCCGGIREATPQTTTPPASETPEPQTTPATPSVEPGTSPLPPVTVEARRRRPARQVEPAAPARSTTPSAPRTTPTTTTPTAPSTPAQPTAATTSPFQPTPALNTITNNQIQATQAQSFGNLFFTLPGATSAGLAPGASRPVLRGLDEFRVRVQEIGIGSMDVSDLGQDHGVPIDPLSIQKVEIYRGPEALRFRSQALGGVVEATNNRIPFAAPLGGWQTQFKSATTTVDRGLEGGALLSHPALGRGLRCAARSR
jgi:iron complex outermembrane receptor protein